MSATGPRRPRIAARWQRRAQVARASILGLSLLVGCHTGGSGIAAASTSTSGADGGPHDAGRGLASSQGGAGTDTSGGAPLPATVARPLPGGAGLEVGRTPWGSDHGLRDDAPRGGSLFSIWARIPDPGTSYPWSRGNMDVYVLYGDNWHLRCLVGNSGARSATDATFNANSMLFLNPGETWLKDYSYYQVEHVPEAPLRDWIWAAWQVVVDDDGTFTIRQWLKFGVAGEVVRAGESRVSLDEIRALAVEKGWKPSDAQAFRPSDAKGFRVGSDHGYITHAHMKAQRKAPTLEELDAIALEHAPADSYWASYALVWREGKADLNDYSGHRRDLSLPAGGRLYAGPEGPLPVGR